MTDAPATHDSEQPIVVGIDGSAEAVAALRWAADAARAYGRPVTVITVKDPLASYGFPITPTPEIEAIIDNSAQAALNETLTQVYGRPDPEGVTRAVREGSPAQELIDASQEASMLVIGARGRGAFPLGSVSERCVRHARSPVVVVR